MDLLFTYLSFVQKARKKGFGLEAAYSVIPHVSLMAIFFSGMLAVALDDFTISIFDMEIKRIVRHFSGQRGQINDMVRVFSLSTKGHGIFALAEVVHAFLF